VGVERSLALYTLADKVRQALIAQKLPFDKKPFSPHITIARRVALKTPVKPEVRRASMAVTRLSLMASERTAGALRYREMYGKAFE